MKPRLLCLFLVMLFLMTACSVSAEPDETPQDLEPARSPSPDIVLPPTPTASVSPPEPSVTLPDETEPPTAVPSKPVDAPSGTPTPSVSPSSPDISPEPTSESPPPTESTTPPSIFTGRIVPEFPEFRFEISSVPDGGLYRADSITVFNNEQVFQSIDLSVYSTGESGITCENHDMDFLLIDMNYDGYMDFRVRDFETPTENNQFLAFLWDAENWQFVFSPELAALSSPDFDAANRQVHSRIEVLPDIIESTYHFENGSLVLLSETMRSLDAGREVWIVTVRERINGIMTVVDSYEEEYDTSI